jgi:hypothetical protein
MNHPSRGNGHAGDLGPKLIPIQADRLPPQNLEAERGVLGAILLAPDRIAEIMPILAVADFYRAPHQQIYGAMLDLYARGIPPEAISLCDELTRRDQFEDLGGDDTITEIVQSVPHAEYATYHAGIVRERSISRQVIDVATEIIRDGYSNQFTAPELVDRAGRALRGIETFGRAYSDEEMGIQPASTVEIKPVEWLMPGRIPRYDYTLVAGPGKQGKSQFAMAVAAKVSTGEAWWDSKPDTPDFAPLGHVLILSAEDDPERVIVPRLKALGANLDRVAICRARKRIKLPGGGHAVSFADLTELAYWREIFSRVEGPVLMIIDPLPSYMGRGINDRKNSDVRSILDPFIDLCKEFGITLIGITHFGKASDGRLAVNKVLDSIAYVNLARAIFYVLEDPDTPGRVLVMPGPGNYGKAGQKALTFTIVEREIRGSTGEAITIGVPEISTETIQVDPDEIVNRQPARRENRPGPQTAKLDDLVWFLFDFMKDKGPIFLRDIIGAAGDAGHIGERVEDEKTGRFRWKGVRRLYEAADRISKSSAPDDGWIVVTSADDPSLRSVDGRTRWIMIRANPPS